MLTTIAILTGLALLDSTSIGTFFIPLWLLLVPGHLRPGRVLFYLVAIALIYLAIGVVLLLGASAAIDGLSAGFSEGGAFDIAPVNGAILIIGLALLAFSFRRPKRTSGPSRITRWRERTMATTSAASLLTLALVAASLEVLTLFPYLGAAAYLASADLSWPERLLWLGFYCFVMVLPALVMLAVRVAMRNRADRALGWLNAQIDRMGGEAALWMLGIFGIILAWFGGSRLFGL